MEQMPLKQKKIGTTIAAISTAQGMGVGFFVFPEHARVIADRVFTSPHGKKIVHAKGYTALYGNVHKPCEEGEQPKILDEAIALIFSGPASFTGEDVVELHVMVVLLS